MKLNLKKTFIVLTIIIASLLLLYLSIFTLCFNNVTLFNNTKSIIAALTQREVAISKASCSPLGDFKISGLNLSNLGGFDKGVFLSVNKLFIKISIIKFLNAYFIANEFQVDGFEINLNFEKKKFDYQELYKEIKNNFNKQYAKYRFIKKMEVKYIFIKNGVINLKLDLGNIKIYDILLRSKEFDHASEYLKGAISFNLKLDNSQTKAICEFNYDKLNKTLRIKDFKCEDLSLYGEGVVSFLDTGDVSLEYNAKIEDIVIYYSSIKEKEIKIAV